MELLINSNSNSNSWEILLTIAIEIAIVQKMSIAIVISILLISSGTQSRNILCVVVNVSSPIRGSMSALHGCFSASKKPGPEAVGPAKNLALQQ